MTFSKTRLGFLIDSIYELAKTRSTATLGRRTLAPDGRNLPDGADHRASLLAPASFAGLESMGAVSRPSGELRGDIGDGAMARPGRFLRVEMRMRGARHTRRSWLARVLIGTAGFYAWPQAARSMLEQEPASDADEVAAVQAIAKKAGLGPFAQSRSRDGHFLGLGDADDRFRNTALSICESLAPAFIQHFNGKGFKLALPKNRLTVITLKSAESYQAFIGKDAGAIVGGHYDLDTNRLVMFDYRPEGEEPSAVNDPARVNRLTLVHETTHMLCFNTGLLSRQANVPDWVAEGLATYVELWRNKQTRIGEPNGPWLSYLGEAKRTGTGWIPITELVADDTKFDDDKTAQLAYAESWLMVHYLLKPQQLPKFRAYLAGLKTGEPAAGRVEYVEKHLGSLKTLAHEVERHFKRGAR
jgi:hypothetical protein